MVGVDEENLRRKIFEEVKRGKKYVRMFGKWGLEMEIQYFILFWISLALAVIFLTILPPAPTPIATLLGHTDIFVSQQEKRPLFFIFAVSMHLLGSIISLLLGASLFALFMLSYATVTTSLLIINFKTKVSVHTAGVTGPLTYVVYFLGIEYTILYLLVIPVIWARYTLRAHTITQLTLGVVDSIVVTFVTCTLWTIITIP